MTVTTVKNGSAPSLRMRVAVLLLVAVTFAGCAQQQAEPPADPKAPFVPGPTQAKVTVLGDPTDDLSANISRLQQAAGTYYSIGSSTFEPTIGATSTGGLFMTEYRGLGAGTHIRRSLDQGQTWEDATPLLPTGTKLVPNSNDPFLYVDPFTDRVYDFDMCIILQGFCVAFSDDDGDSWTIYSIATGEAPALDHQSLAAAPADGSGSTTVGYPNVLTFCVNRGTTVTGSWCSSSFDGGLGWTPLAPGFPATTPQCSGLSGHVVGSPDGAFYRGQPSCDGPAVYRSTDGGLTWTEHTITTSVGIRGHELSAAVDAAGGVHAFWIGDDGLPYLASSADRGDTWTEARMVGAPGVTAAGFPTAVGGDPGRVAFAYIGTDVADGYSGDRSAMEWTGYIGLTLDAYATDFVVANTPVNVKADPLDKGRACGAMRCGGFGDFIDITLDAEGRPWAALAHNGHNDAGIVGTIMTGPALIGDHDLSPLPAGGPAAWT